MDREHQFFAAVAARGLVRPSVRAIVRSDRGFLVQRPTTEDTNYAFIGGEYELGDTFESRIRREFEEETSARVVSIEYRFVVENRFIWNGNLVHGLEHYLEVTLDRVAIESREPYLQQLWLSTDIFASADVRPIAVRDILSSGDWMNVRHMTITP